VLASFGVGLAANVFLLLLIAGTIVASLRRFFQAARSYSSLLPENKNPAQAKLGRGIMDRERS
jgi:hypothetical protein